MSTKTERLRKWRAENPERNKTSVKAWLAKHPGYNIEYKRKWRAKNRKRHNAANKAWRIKNSERNNANHQKWIEKNAARFIFRKCKISSKRRNKNFSLTLTWVEEKLAVGICERTGLPFVFKKETSDLLLSQRRNNLWFPSIDRIDSSLGYTENNCQMVCVMYNVAKNEWSDVEFLKLARALIEYTDKDPLE